MTFERLDSGWNCGSGNCSIVLLIPIPILTTSRNLILFFICTYMCWMTAQYIRESKFCVWSILMLIQFIQMISNIWKNQGIGFTSMQSCKQNMKSNSKTLIFQVRSTAYYLRLIFKIILPIIISWYLSGCSKRYSNYTICYTIAWLSL